MSIIRKSITGILFLVFWGALVVAPTYAQETGENQIVTVDFLTMSFEERLLRGPFGEETYTFTLPPTWSLIEGATVELDLTVFKPENHTLGGLIEISFNRTIVSTIPLDWNGERTISVPLTEASLPSVRPDGRHEFKVSLDSGIGCESDFQTSVVVRSTSHFTFPYETITIPTDLRNLPRPIYQPNFIPSSTLIVVPDHPTVQELQAAMTVAAGFGDMTSNGLLFSLIPLSELTEETRANNHLIFVGKTTVFPLLMNLYFPMALDRSQSSAADRTFTDGLIEMIVSPWNESNVLLVVSGDSDAAVLRAAQAISTGRIRTGGQTDATLISDVNYETAFNSSALLNRTFADASYTTQTMSNEGRNSTSYTFYVPQGLQAGNDAYLDLYFNHSTLLNYEQSGLIVGLNNVPIGSASFSDNTSGGTTVRIPIPRRAVQVGNNTLSIVAELAPRSPCLESNSESLWVTIGAESLMNVPLVPMQAPPVPVTELRRYPAPYTTDPNLADTAFIVPADDPTAWDVAAHIAADIGNRRSGVVTQFVVAYADNVPQRVRTDYHLIVVGQPNTLPFLSEINNSLPAPFEAGSNFALEDNLSVDYRLPASASVGYLEFIESPFNPLRTVLTVFGSDAPGVGLAGTALVDPAIRSTLNGNFVVTDGVQVLIARVNPVLITEGLPEATPEATAFVLPEPAAEATGEVTAEAGAQGGSPTSTASVDRRPNWLLPVTIGTLGLMVLTVVVVITQSYLRMRNRRRRRAAAASQPPQQTASDAASD